MCALSPFGLLVHDRRCLLLTTVLSWPVKAPARQRYATMGALGELPAPAAACRLLLAACCLLGGLLGFFSLPETIERSEEWDISVGENCVSRSFCVAYWIFWTVLKLIAVQNKACFWEKGKMAEESLMLIRFWSSLSSVVLLLHDYIWQFEWNLQIWGGCAMRGAKKKFKSVCHAKFSEAN